jgi:Rod binding domain-containing protein
MSSVSAASQTPSGVAKASGNVAAGDARLRRAAKDFEAMFMTEMLHHARPTSKAAGIFAAGAGEKAWQIVMDQALGQAASAQSGSGLTREIEAALKAAKAPHGGAQ